MAQTHNKEAAADQATGCKVLAVKEEEQEQQQQQQPAESTSSKIVVIVNCPVVLFI